MEQELNTTTSLAGTGLTVKQKLREVYGWNLADLADHLGVTISAISAVVLGKNISPYLQEEIAKAVGVRSQEIFGDLWWVPRKAAWLRKRQERTR